MHEDALLFRPGFEVSFKDVKQFLEAEVKSYMRKITEVQEEIANMEAEQALNNSKTIKSQVKK